MKLNQYILTILIIIAVVVISKNTGLADVNSPAITNAEYNEYIAKSADFSDAEKELNTAYKRLMSVLDSSAKEQIKREQRDWIKARESEAFNTGKKGSFEYLTKLSVMSKNRAKELQLKYQGATASQNLTNNQSPSTSPQDNTPTANVSPSSENSPNANPASDVTQQGNFGEKSNVLVSPIGNQAGNVPSIPTPAPQMAQSGNANMWAAVAIAFLFIFAGGTSYLIPKKN